MATHQSALTSIPDFSPSSEVATTQQTDGTCYGMLWTLNNFYFILFYFLILLFFFFCFFFFLKNNEEACDNKVT